MDLRVSVTYYEPIQSDANIWVKVPSIPTGTSKIYVYYGNPAAQDVESYDNTFDTYNISKACSGSTAGGYCSVTFDPSSDLGGNYVFFRDQRYGYGTLDFLMSGDFDYGGAYADPTTCNTGGYERVAVYLNGNCYGTYTTGYQDCTDRRPATWPKNVGSLIAGQSSLTAEGDTDLRMDTQREAAQDCQPRANDKCRPRDDGHPNQRYWRLLVDLHRTEHRGGA